MAKYTSGNQEKIHLRAFENQQELCERAVRMDLVLLARFFLGENQASS